MSDPEKVCPDCRGELRPALLLDSGNPFWRELRYANVREKGSLVPTPEGKVKAWICEKCNRVLLYAEPGAK